MKRLCLFVAMSAVCGWAPRADAEEVEPPRVLELEIPAGTGGLASNTGNADESL